MRCGESKGVMVMGEKTVHIELWDMDGKSQLVISEIDENGAGGGYRLMGPKFCACCPRTLVRKVTVDRTMAEQLRRYANKVLEESVPTTAAMPTDSLAAWAYCQGGEPQS